jgi:hypothetical protein
MDRAADGSETKFGVTVEFISEYPHSYAPDETGMKSLLL